MVTKCLVKVGPHELILWTAIVAVHNNREPLSSGVESWTGFVWELNNTRGYVRYDAA